MESLGGDQLWWDRFLAQHAAVFYYWVLILFYTLAPRMAYVFSELVEVGHDLSEPLFLACHVEQEQIGVVEACWAANGTLCLLAVCAAPQSHITHSLVSL